MARTDVARFALENGFLHDNTLRLIRLGLPFLQVRATIDRQVDERHYSLIKRTLYDLLTGQDPKAKPPVAYVQDRQEAFALLGLDREFYDVANRLFLELVAEGKVHETPQGVLAGKAPANDPVYKTAKRATNHTCNLLVNPLTADICVEAFQNQPFYTKENLLASFKSDICPVPVPAYVYDPEIFQRLINDRNFYFEDCSEEFKTRRLREQNLPAGTYGIQLDTEDLDFSPGEFWIPYFLTLERTENGNVYQLYGCKSGTCIDFFPINDPDYQILQDFVDSLLGAQFFNGLTYPLTDIVQVSLTHKAGKPVKGVTMDEDGNYTTPLTDLQLALICMDKTEDVVTTLTVVTEGRAVIPALEVGRLVRFALTEEQQDFCRQVLEDPERRYELALPILQAAADRGDKDARYHLANCTLMGRGREADPSQAYQLYQQLAEEGHVWGTYYQGYCLTYGVGTDPDPQAALAAFEEIPQDSKVQALPLALYQIAQIHTAKRDYEKAFEALQAGVNLKLVNPMISFLLGSFYMLDATGKKDLVQAKTHLQAAAKRGVLPAQAGLIPFCVEEHDISKAQALLEQVLQPLQPEDYYFWGAKSFVPYPHLCFTQEMLQGNRTILEQSQDMAKRIQKELTKRLARKE